MAAKWNSEDFAGYCAYLIDQMALELTSNPKLANEKSLIQLFSLQNKSEENLREFMWLRSQGDKLDLLR
jgi:hypothetical protein